MCKNHSDSTEKFSQTDIINMLECLIDNIFVMFGPKKSRPQYISAQKISTLFEALDEREIAR